MFQWHPEHKIGFAYVPSKASWYDYKNLKAAELQEVVLECAKKAEA